MTVVEQQDVARVGVGVEGPVEHHLPEQAVEQLAGKRLPRFRGQPGRSGKQRSASEELHDEHPLAAVRLIRRWHPDGFVPGGRRGRHRGHVSRLDPQVEFLAQRVGESLGEVDRADGTAPAGAAL